MNAPDLPTGEFLNETSEVHAAGVATSLGIFTGWLRAAGWEWLSLGVTFVFLTVVTGIRFTALLKRSDLGAADMVKGEPTELLRDLRREGHYTVTFFLTALVVTLLLAGAL